MTPYAKLYELYSRKLPGHIQLNLTGSFFAWSFYKCAAKHHK